MYVASNHFVWRLVPVSIASQIRQLLQDKQFELALQLAVRNSHHAFALYACEPFLGSSFHLSNSIILHYTQRK